MFLLCGDQSEALQAGVQEGKNLHHMLENYSVGSSLAPTGRWGCQSSCWGKMRWEMHFIVPLHLCVGHPESMGWCCTQHDGCQSCQALSTASSSSPCIRALFTFGLPSEALVGTGAVALFSLKQ